MAEQSRVYDPLDLRTVFKAKVSNLRLNRNQFFADCEIEVSATTLEELFKLVDQVLEQAEQRSAAAQSGKGVSIR